MIKIVTYKYNFFYKEVMSLQTWYGCYKQALGSFKWRSRYGWLRIFYKRIFLICSL